MSNREKVSKFKRPLVAGVVASLALIAAYKAPKIKLDFPSGNINTLPHTSDAETAEIYGPHLPKIGRLVLERAVTDGIVSEEKEQDGVFDAVITSFDGKTLYEVIVKMHEDKKGRPDPKMTSEVFVQTYYDTGPRKNDLLLITNHKKDAKKEAWGAVYKHFRYGEQDKPKVEAYSGLLTKETNQDIAKLADLLIEQAVLSPEHLPPENSDAPDQPII